MKKILFSLMMLAACITASAQFTSAPAFPGAEGYGRYATGGRGGQVYHVTNLNDSGEGSLRAAVEASGKRIVVFDVDGTIELQSRMNVKNPNITILGQTAPGQGICLKGNSFYISTNNVVIRYIRCRMGDGIDDDAMSSSHHDGSECRNIIIDHCSLSWSTDEVGSFYGNENFTLQWCILSESLNDSQAKGSSGHGFGGIWGGKKASFHHNLLAHNNSRMIRFDHGYVSTLTGPVDYVNNVIYNWGGNSAYGGENNEGCESKKFNMINNYYKAGPSTTSNGRILNPSTACGNCTGTPVPGSFYIAGTYMNGVAASINTSSIRMDSDSPIAYNVWQTKYLSQSKFTVSDEEFQYSTISMQTAPTAYNQVLAYAGCSFSRDDIDTRVINDTKNMTGQLIGASSSRVSWPALTAGTPKTDTDLDGMPDEWETAHGLNPNVNDAAKYNLDSKRYYTNIEVYAASLVENDIKAGRSEASETFEEYYPDYQNGESASADETVFYEYLDKQTIDDHSVIVYPDGAQLVLTGKNVSSDGKQYSSGSDLTINQESAKSIKLSNGAANTFYAPEGKGISSVTIYSYVNADSGNAYWAQVGPNTYTSSTATLMSSFKDGANPDVQTFNIGGATSMVLLNGGKQLCFAFSVTYGEISGIATVSSDSRNASVNTYNIMGQRVNAAHKGVIITNGKKNINK